jgi:hypothetical protein
MEAMNQLPSLSSKAQKEEYWKSHFKEQEKSGQTRKRYCEVQGISCIQFGYWLRRISLKENSTVNSPISLVAVKLRAQNELPQSISAATLILKNGCFLKIHTMEALSFLLERMS